MRGTFKNSGLVMVTFLLCLLTVVTESALGVVNNGFETNYVYALEGGGDDLRVFNETNFAVVIDDLYDSTTEVPWRSLTFSGVGANDARLFLAKDVDTDANSIADDIRIIELNSSGQTVNVTNLSTITGSPISTTTLTFGNIRFSKFFPTSLFMAATSDVTGTDRGMVWEIDLGLTTLKNTYTGPVMAPPDSYDGSLRATMIALNDNDGTLYVTGRYLNEPDRSTGLGDLVAMDTSGGSTNLFTILIDGTSYAAGSPTPTWYWPQFLTFRSRNPDDFTPTILVAEAKASWTYISEFYLDTALHPVDVNGNLAQRAFNDNFEGKFPSKGQEDEISHSVWYGGAIGGLYEIRSDDVVNADYFLASHPKMTIQDADSPFHPGPFPPWIYEVSPDTDLVGVGTEYIEQLGLAEGTPPITWSVVQGPTGLQVDTSGRVYGWTPTKDQVGYHTLEIQASNAAGSDTEVWQVRVLDTNNGFPKEWVYMCRHYAEDGNIRAFWEENELHAVSDWTDWKNPPRDVSLTFSGTGDNDARMFAIKCDPLSTIATDILIKEMKDLDDLASRDPRPVVNQAYLGVLAGLGQNNLGPDVEDGHIRYSAFHDSLFIGVNPDEVNSTAIKVYEVDLGLTTVLNTYTGPNITSGPVDIALDPVDGTLYVVSPNLNGTGGAGDLIAFDTSGGSTSTYTTLIDGATLSDPHWINPGAIVYRGKRNPTPRPTILVIMKDIAASVPALEFYLDEVDGNGNLVKRGEPLTIQGGTGGQMDLATGTIWLSGGYLAAEGDMQGLAVDDSIIRYSPPSSGRRWMDAASPPGTSICNLSGARADADKDGDVDQDDFGMFQVCLTGENGGIPSSPAFCECFNSDGDDDIDGQDFLAFQNCATGPDIPLDTDNPPPGCIP